MLFVAILHTSLVSVFTYWRHNICSCSFKASHIIDKVDTNKYCCIKDERNCINDDKMYHIFSGTEPLPTSLLCYYVSYYRASKNIIRIRQMAPLYDRININKIIHDISNYDFHRKPTN